MTPPRLLPLAAWWHRVRLHVVHHDVTVWDNGHRFVCRHRIHCATCAKGLS